VAWTTETGGSFGVAVGWTTWTVGGTEAVGVSCEGGGVPGGGVRFSSGSFWSLRKMTLDWPLPVSTKVSVTGLAVAVNVPSTELPMTTSRAPMPPDSSTVQSFVPPPGKRTVKTTMQGPSAPVTPFRGPSPELRVMGQPPTGVSPVPMASSLHPFRGTTHGRRRPPSGHRLVTLQPH